MLVDDICASAIRAWRVVTLQPQINSIATKDTEAMSDEGQVFLPPGKPQDQNHHLE
ncbi:hypothetical protein TanjilG_25014 [Lupinus angustifolius]|uniref:Uncharacterized protein n=1 Tax=Lupinus angustifolius TaxID=3871 RepID=A0A1J7H0V5_LUPAN|nr:hypothetical protein TanjilG_25014 [Lupinus angustifolius]